MNDQTPAILPLLRFMALCYQDVLLAIGQEVFLADALAQAALLLTPYLYGCALFWWDGCSASLCAS
ncbi:MAG: hypothetical protein AB1894_09670 [Chloroflexota bacterium]